MRLAGRTRVRFRGRPACEPQEPGGLRSADAEEAHHLTAGQRPAVPVQFSNELGVGALPVHRTAIWLVQRRCGRVGALRCTSSGALRCTGTSALERGRCSALHCGLVNQGEQRARLQPDAVVG